MKTLKNQGFFVCQKSERFPSISIVIPAYNEEKRIYKTLKDYLNFFNKKHKKDFEIIVVLNGCKDNTLDVVKSFKKKYSQIRYLDFKKAGKGFAIIEGFKVARGEIMGFTDADNATAALEFNKLIENLNGFDGAIASRWIKGSVVKPKQPLIRRIAGRGFNFLNRVLFGFKFKDTQCGAKLFRKEAAKKIIPKLGITEWAFDADLLYQAKVHELKIKEVPIKWQDVRGSKLNILKTPLRMFLSLIRIRLIHSQFNFIVRFYDFCIPDAFKIHRRLK